MLFRHNDDEDLEEGFYTDHAQDDWNGYGRGHEDGNGGEYGDGPFSDRERGRSAMRSAAMVLAVISILSSMMIYISIPLGAVAIVLAFLSRGNRKTLGKAKTAVTVAAAGMIASTAITGYAFYRVTTDPVLRRQMQQMVEYYSGAYLGQSASEAFPWLFEKTEETESETGMAWSDDLLNDHDRLVDYFTTPQGDAAKDTSDHTGDSHVQAAPGSSETGAEVPPATGPADSGERTEHSTSANDKTDDPEGTDSSASDQAEKGGSGEPETDDPGPGTVPVFEPPAGSFTGGSYT